MGYSDEGLGNPEVTHTREGTLPESYTLETAHSWGPTEQVVDVSGVRLTSVLTLL